ncbi:hypothetical protein MKW92_051027 [Papaver armeniacum]|nr:hypothetical protein MKW92_051027 [Papaver armeniacum]
MWTWFFKLVIFLFLVLLIQCKADFVYNGFEDANLTLDGEAKVAENGLLSLTDTNKRYAIGHAFFSDPVQFKTMFPLVPITLFPFLLLLSLMSSKYGSQMGGQGMAFVIAPQRGLPGAFPNQFLGLFNDSTNGKSTNHVLAVELDPVTNEEFDNVKGPHVGIDINGLMSLNSTYPTYITNDGESKNLSLTSGDPLQVWIEYDGIDKKLSVTLAPINVSKPNVPLLSLSQDLSDLFLGSMYVGFSASTQSSVVYHYILGWSFAIDGKAQPLDLWNLPEVPQPDPQPPELPAMILTVMLSAGIPIVVFVVIFLAIFFFLRNRKFAELVEDWEQIYGTHRFTFKELYKATNGFGKKEIVGRGAFGEVYRGVLPSTKIQVATKKVTHDSRHGMQQFIAEIVSIGKLRHTET